MPDFGLSKDSLRNLVNLAGEFVGTTDTLTLTNKTISLNSNTITATSGSLGDLIAHDGTSYVRKAKGTANQAYVTNSGATDTGWGTLAVGGGGTGATTLTGILKGSGTSAITAVAAPTGAILGDSDVQNITGGKTFFDQILKVRNPANTFTGTWINPALTADRNLELEKPGNFVIYKAGSNFKALNCTLSSVDYTNTDAYTVINSVFGVLGSSVGGTIYFKNALYTLANPLQPPLYVDLVGDSQFGQVIFQPTGDWPAIRLPVDNGGVDIRNIRFHHTQPAYTSGLLEIREGCQTVNINGCYFYDGANFVGNAIKFSNQNTSGLKGIYKVMTRNCEFYGFMDSVLAEVTTSPNYVNGCTFTDCNFWLPKNSAFRTNAVASSNVDACNFVNCQIQAAPTGTNTTQYGFDYGGDSGRHWTTTHLGVLIWDLASSRYYARLNTVTELEMIGCIPSYRIPTGGGATKARSLGWWQNHRGRTVFSGDGTTKTFTVTHNMGGGSSAAANVAIVRPGSSDAMGDFYVNDATMTNTAFTITYPIAPPAGTSNLIFYWEVAFQPT